MTERGVAKRWACPYNESVGTPDQGAQMRRFVLLFLLLALTAAFSASALGARRGDRTGDQAEDRVVRPILATKGHLALYTWNQEKGLKIKCTGACAKTWPPLTIPHGTMAPKHIAGVMGTFGDVMRPDGKTQVTYNGHPLYTLPRRHADEDPLQRRRRLVRRQGALARWNLARPGSTAVAPSSA